jgi:hypothetical protein
MLEIVTKQLKIFLLQSTVYTYLPYKRQELTRRTELRIQKIHSLYLSPDITHLIFQCSVWIQTNYTDM